MCFENCLFTHSFVFSCSQVILIGRLLVQLKMRSQCVDSLLVESIKKFQPVITALPRFRRCCWLLRFLGDVSWLLSMGGEDDIHSSKRHAAPASRHTWPRRFSVTLPPAVRFSSFAYFSFQCWCGIVRFIVHCSAGCSGLPTTSVCCFLPEVDYFCGVELLHDPISYLAGCVIWQSAFA